MESDRIHNNISINGIPVGGLLKEEAKQKVTDAVLGPVGGRRILVRSNDRQWTFELIDLNYSFDIDSKVNEAFEIARTGTDEERKREIMNLQNVPYDIPLEITYDNSQINTFLEKIASEIYQAPSNPSMVRQNGQVVITGEGSGGLAVDIIETKNQMLALIETGGEVELELIGVAPAFTPDDLVRVNQLLGTYSTGVTGSASRDANIITAARFVNGTLLFPGEIFSTNKTLSPYTWDRGYRPAPVIINGRLAEGMGGGVCQVSSTLYNAVLFAELEVVERRNHSLAVGYIPIGRDATLAGDYIDFKFRNTSSMPVYIETYLDGRRLVSSIYGVETRPANRTIDFESIYVGPSMVDVFKKVFVDGKVTDRVYIDRSAYRTGSSAATADPVEEPLPEPEASDSIVQETHNEPTQSNTEGEGSETPADTEISLPGLPDSTESSDSSGPQDSETPAAQTLPPIPPEFAETMETEQDTSY
jgi:vancomycin resistance protein YoaR